MLAARRFLFAADSENEPILYEFIYIECFFSDTHEMKSSLFCDLLFNLKEFVFQIVVASHLSEIFF